MSPKCEFYSWCQDQPALPALPSMTPSVILSQCRVHVVHSAKYKISTVLWSANLQGTTCLHALHPIPHLLLLRDGKHLVSPQTVAQRHPHLELAKLTCT